MQSGDNNDDNQANEYTSKVATSDRKFPIQPGVLPQNVAARAKCVAQGKIWTPDFLKNKF